MKVTRAALTVVLTLALYAGPLAVQVQQVPKVARVGVLAGGGPGFHAGFEPFRQRLRELGYVEDQTIAIVVRNAEGRAERYPELAAELVRLHVDVIVVQGNAALVALKQATQTIPVVMANIGDPVGAGFVASLARPGGNIKRGHYPERHLDGEFRCRLEYVRPNGVPQGQPSAHSSRRSYPGAGPDG